MSSYEVDAEAHRDDDDLALAMRLAREAGALLLDRWWTRSELTVTTKRRGDFVSAADQDAEHLLRQGFSQARPDDGWLGEETGASAAATRRWIVDPLDGTTNFLHGIGHWAVSVALEELGELTLGVVHDPLRDETFTAQRGAGASLGNERLHSSGGEDFSAALFGTGIPFGELPHIDDHAADIARLAPRCAGIRRMGAAALDLAWVAAGRFDGFWERRLQPWDCAAGLVLLREAGARVEGWTQAERPEDSGTVLAASPTLFPVFAAIIRNTMPTR